MIPSEDLQEIHIIYYSQYELWNMGYLRSWWSRMWHEWLILGTFNITHIGLSKSHFLFLRLNS